jgi:hypothetical protein
MRIGGFTIMRTSSLLLAVALVAVILPTSSTAQADGGVPDFDFERINIAGHPAHPGLDYSFFPISDFAAEGSGISVADVNRDGLLDAMFCGIEGRPNQLYINDGDGTFTESAAALGVDEPSKRRGNSLLFDYDNDGDLDLMTFGYPGWPVYDLDLYSFFRNDGAPGYGFTDVTAGVGGFAFGATSETTTLGIPGGAAAADYDNDGYLDVIVTYWMKNTQASGWFDDQFRLWRNVPNPDPDLGQPDYSPRLFVDATLEAGLDGVGYGWIWMPSWVDINRDGLMDLHINIETNEDELRLNQGDGTFGPNIAIEIGMNYNGNGTPFNVIGAGGNEMGTAFADMDNDGDLDAYLTNAGFVQLDKKDAFYRNDSDLSEGGGGLAFTYIGESTGVTVASDNPGWGVVFPDLDNDTDLDLITARGMGQNISQNAVWENHFPATAGEHEAPLFEDALPSLSTAGLNGCWDAARSLVSFDYDNDGDLDVLYTRSGSIPPHPADKLDAAMYRNTMGNGNGWLQLDLVETGGSLNTVGARVFVRTRGSSGVVQMKEVQCGSSFLGQEPSRLHFGLGATSGEADYVVVRWFDGGLTVLTASTAALSGLVEIQRGADTFTGDLDGDAQLTELDLELLVLSLTDPAAVDASVPADWPWRHTADLDGNGVVEAPDFAALRALVPGTWADIGGALPGASTPTLSGTGTLSPGTSMTIDLSGALPASASWLLMGFDLLAQPFKGGVLVPSLDFDPIGPLLTDGLGELSLGATWPGGLPAGTQIQYQMWVQDAGGPAGFAASNALSSITP